MASMVKGAKERQLALGFKVEEPAAVLPATATSHIFLISGGRVVVTSLVGQVTTVCSGTATTVSLGTTPTVGTANTTGLSTATAITSLEVGSLVSLPLTKGALQVGSNGGAGVQIMGDGGLVVPAGNIDITTSATNTGAFKWTLTYYPFDDGAFVTAV